MSGFQGVIGLLVVADNDIKKPFLAFSAPWRLCSLFSVCPGAFRRGVGKRRRLLMSDSLVYGNVVGCERHPSPTDHERVATAVAAEVLSDAWTKRKEA